MGKKVNFQYMDYKVKTLWQLEGKLTMLELGCDFYMFRFEYLGDYAKVLSGRPWYILDLFLALRKWDHFFKPSMTTLSSIVV